MIYYSRIKIFDKKITLHIKKDRKKNDYSLNVNVKIQFFY
jgi:hypothetical protein